MVVVVLGTSLVVDLSHLILVSGSVQFAIMYECISWCTTVLHTTTSLTISLSCCELIQNIICSPAAAAVAAVVCKHKLASKGLHKIHIETHVNFMQDLLRYLYMIVRVHVRVH